MLKFIMVFIIALNLYANDFVNLYRFKGISEVEKEIENSLKDINYWKSYLADKNVDLGYYEYKKYVIVAQKEQSELSLYEKIGYDYKLVLRNSVIVGESQGDKYLEGDKKTPEGAYELIEKKTEVDQFYGPFALVTSYPNSFDMSLDKKGSGIWIHGMPFQGDREKFTRGCIALDNQELENLEKNIDYKKTILLTSQNEFEKASKDDIALILSSIYKWKDAWKYSNIEEYLSFYSKEFKKSDKSNFAQFEDYKKQIFSKNEDKTITFKNIDIAPYPNSLNKKMYKVLMDEEYLSPSVKFYGKKELFLEVANNEVKILTED
ncbi:L,D-transpeptidase family protein [Arcobacter ellisii]|uniref:Peptidoglycan peptidase 2 n=2 Tax=Arcobacter ellisii TaxID=913109 RepID=A0ABM6YN88_9BACT|nr:L,D-transpeptidase family protein [Arcobacter ellisii]AXX95675.1 peptidoglycan peptidase 2 [Arcobacter ellisii]